MPAVVRWVLAKKNSRRWNPRCCGYCAQRVIRGKDFNVEPHIRRWMRRSRSPRCGGRGVCITTKGAGSGRQPARRSRRLAPDIAQSGSQQARTHKRVKFSVVLPQGPRSKTGGEGTGEAQCSVRDAAGGEDRDHQQGGEREEKEDECFHDDTLVQNHSTPERSGKFRKPRDDYENSSGVTHP